MSSADAEGAPYVGPRPYGEDDRAVFFGRDAEIAELVSLVIANRSVLLHAVSGAGKSSLLRAGVDVALAEHGFDVLGPLRLQSPATPGDVRNVYAYEALRALSDLVDSDPGPLDTSLSIADCLAGLARGTDSYGFPRPRVLVFDQFEEIFTTHAERWQHREDFMREVADALDRDPELRVLFSMREEYNAQLERYAGLMPDDLRARFHLERFRAPAALAAVKGPLEARGVEFDTGVAEALVKDLRETRVDAGGDTPLRVEGEFVEPVHLQVVCRTLWGRMDPSKRHVTAGDLAALGNVDDSLVQYYDGAIAVAATRASVTEHKLRSELERALITSAGTRATVFAGETETASLPVAALDVLADRHVIRAEWRAGGRWLELAHDRLIEPIRNSNERARTRRRRRRRRRRTILAVPLAIMVLAAVAAAYLLLPQRVAVPALVGEPDLFAASKRLAAADLAVALPTETRVDVNAPAGSVIDQSPAAGKKVDRGSGVVLVVAGDAGRIQVPRLKGLTRAEAQRLLRNAGLQLGPVTGTADPAAVITQQIPAAGLSVVPGSAVEVSLARVSR